MFSMAKRRTKRTVRKPASPLGTINGTAPEEEPPVENERDKFRDLEVERQCAAIRAIRDVETEQLRTWLRLLRSYFNEEQLRTPLRQFFHDNLPNLDVTNEKDGQYEVQWRDKERNFSISQVNGANIHASLLQRLSIAYPDCSAAVPSFGGFEFSSKAVKTSLLGAESLQIRDFVLEEPPETQMLGFPDSLRTPGVSSQRLSVGMTPKTLRLPKQGEMLLSVHGSPLGVYKEDNMEAIQESDET